MKLKLYDSENNFCGILWEKGPLGRRELMDLCRVRLGWKGSVTRTAIRRMVKRGAVQVEDGVVSMRVGREDTEVTTKVPLRPPPRQFRRHDRQPRRRHPWRQDGPHRGRRSAPDDGPPYHQRQLRGTALLSPLSSFLC